MILIRRPSRSHKHTIHSLSLPVPRLSFKSFILRDLGELQLDLLCAVVAIERWTCCGRAACSTSSVPSTARRPSRYRAAARPSYRRGPGPLRAHIGQRVLAHLVQRHLLLAHRAAIKHRRDELVRLVGRLALRLELVQQDHISNS